MNLAEHMRRAGQDQGSRAAIAQGKSVRFNYAQLASRVSRLAHALRFTLALPINSRVALAMSNSLEYIEILYACWHAGLTVIPINAKLHKKEFAYILSDAAPELCFSTPELTASVSQATPTTSIRVIDVSSRDYQALFNCEMLPIEPRSPTDAAWIFYTSGTTGNPKGAVLSHRNLQAMCTCYFLDIDPQGPWQSILHAAPMSHGSGLYAIPHVLKASCHVIPESQHFDVCELYRLIEHWDNCVFFAAPTMVKRLLDHSIETDTDNLKLIIYGGGPMYLEDSLNALSAFGPKLVQIYGQGESPMSITVLSQEIHAQHNHPDWEKRLSSVGLPQSLVEVIIVDANDNPLPEGEVGELLVRGDTVMIGYLNNQTASNITLRNGWLHTGDCGLLDEKGFITLKDREKDLIISGGSNIYPREVEEILVKHPNVLEASVIGRRDKVWGETVVAFIVSKDKKPLNSEELDQLCLRHIARFKRPKHYQQLDNLPKNNYGKVLKKTLRELDANSPDF